MSDHIHPRRFNVGTTAERGAFTLPIDADGAEWWDTDRALMFKWTGAEWIGVHALSSPDGLTEPALSVDNSGQVGIGTATPATLLEVSGAGNVATFGDGSGTADILFDSVSGGSGGFFIQSAGSNRWRVGKNATAESGADVGSDFRIRRLDDAAASLGDAFFIKRSTGYVGINDTLPDTILSIQESQAAGETIIDHENTAAVSASNVINYRTIAQSSTQARTIFQLKSSWSVTTDATRTSKVEFVVSSSGVSTTPITILGGSVGISAGTPLARLHVDQGGGGAAIPVLYLDQADVSEEMIEFATTIGVGNAIEAVGAKVLTVTHFIKVTIPGPLTRYFAVGTIA